jgi:hypothetical protein
VTARPSALGAAATSIDRRKSSTSCAPGMAWSPPGMWHDWHVPAPPARR